MASKARHDAAGVGPRCFITYLNGVLGFAKRGGPEACPLRDTAGAVPTSFFKAALWAAFLLRATPVIVPFVPLETFRRGCVSRVLDMRAAPSLLKFRKRPHSDTDGVALDGAGSWCAQTVEHRRALLEGMSAQSCSVLRA